MVSSSHLCLLMKHFYEYSTIWKALVPHREALVPHREVEVSHREVIVATTMKQKSKRRKKQAYPRLIHQNCASQNVLCLAVQRQDGDTL